MSNTVVTSTPVVVTSQEPEHPVVRHKNSLCGIGITEIFIGLYAAGLGFYYVHVANAYRITDDFLYVGLSAGTWFIISGSLAIAAGSCPNGCNIVGGIIVAILASFAAVGVVIKEAVILMPLFSCQGDCYINVGLVIAHSLLAVLAFVEFILSIVHASYSCNCCGHPYAPIQRAAMTVTTTSIPVMQPVRINPGKGYVPLTNPPEGNYSMAYAPQQPQQAYNDYPPPYN